MESYKHKSVFDNFPKIIFFFLPLNLWWFRKYELILMEELCL